MEGSLGSAAESIPSYQAGVGRHCVSLLGHSRAACPWAGAVEAGSGASEAWVGLGGGQVQQGRG